MASVDLNTGDHVVPMSLARYKLVPFVEPPLAVPATLPMYFLDEFIARHTAFVYSRTFGRRVALIDRHKHKIKVYEYRLHGPDAVDQTIPHRFRAAVFDGIPH